MAKRRPRKLYTDVEAPELYAKVQSRDDEKYDALFEQLRVQYEDGDPLALNTAFLICHNTIRSIPRWVAAALPVRLHEEMRKSSPNAAKSKKRFRRILKQSARYETVMWFWRQCGSLDEALWRAARAFKMSDNGMRKDYKALRKKHKNLFGVPPLPSEEVGTPAHLLLGLLPSPSKEGWTPADLPEGPSIKTLKDVLAREY